MGHVNNATYLDWIEEGLGALGIDAAAALPRAFRLEYRASAAPGDEVTVATWLEGERWQARIARPDGVEFVRGTGPRASGTGLSGAAATG